MSRRRFPIVYLLLVNFFLPGIAQNAFYREGTTPESVRGRPLSVGGYLFVNGISRELADAGSSNIYRYDSTGAVHKFNAGKYVWTIQGTLDSRLILFAQERRCTWQPDTLDFFLEKRETDGTVIASRKISNGVNALVQKADSTFMLFLWDNKTLIKADKNLNIDPPLTHALGNVHDAILLQNGSIVVSHNPGTGEKISLIDGNGNVLSGKSLTKPLQELQLMGSSRFCSYAQNVFYIFDYSLTQLLAKPVQHVQDFYCANDSVYALMRKSNGDTIYYTVLSESMVPLQQNSVRNYVPVSLGRRGVYSAILYEPVTLTKGWVGHYLSHTERLKTPIPTEDISLYHLAVDSAFIVTRGDGFYDVYARLNYYVSNAFFPVNSFSITTELSAGETCGIEHATMNANVALAPKQSTVVSSSGFYRKTGKLHNGLGFVEYCAVAFSPDNEFDSAPANNWRCVGVYFDPTNVRNEDIAALFTIAPNPVSDLLTVSSSEAIENLEVISADGMILMARHSALNAATLDVSSLPAGLYLLRVTGGGSWKVKKFVKY